MTVPTTPGTPLTLHLPHYQGGLESQALASLQLLQALVERVQSPFAPLLLQDMLQQLKTLQQEFGDAAPVEEVIQTLIFRQLYHQHEHHTGKEIVSS